MDELVLIRYRERERAILMDSKLTIEERLRRLLQFSSDEDIEIAYPLLREALPYKTDTEILGLLRRQLETDRKVSS